MGIALNFSIFQYDYMLDYDGVVKFIQKAIDGAMKKIDSLRNDQDREDTKTIVELMRDNM